MPCQRCSSLTGCRQTASTLPAKWEREERERGWEEQEEQGLGGQRWERELVEPLEQQRGRRVLRRCRRRQSLLRLDRVGGGGTGRRWQPQSR